MTVSILLLFENHHWKYEVYNTAVSPPSFWIRYTDQTQQKNVTENHMCSVCCVWCTALAVLHETDVQICLFESYVFTAVGFAIHGTGSLSAVSSKVTDQFLFVNSLIIFLLHNPFWRKVLMKTLFFSFFHHSFYCFTQQWRVNCQWRQYSRLP